MARQRKITPERRAFIGRLLAHYQPNDANDIQECSKICWVTQNFVDIVGKLAHCSAIVYIDRRNNIWYN